MLGKNILKGNNMGAGRPSLPNGEKKDTMKVVRMNQAMIEEIEQVRLWLEETKDSRLKFNKRGEMTTSDAINYLLHQGMMVANRQMKKTIED